MRTIIKSITLRSIIFKVIMLHLYNKRTLRRNRIKISPSSGRSLLSFEIGRIVFELIPAGGTAGIRIVTAISVITHCAFGKGRSMMMTIIRRRADRSAGDPPGAGLNDTVIAGAVDNPIQQLIPPADNRAAVILPGCSGRKRRKSQRKSNRQRNKNGNDLFHIDTTLKTK